MNADKIISQFQQRFTGAPTIVRSPGRINLIGEHTDYNYGLVLPAAIDKEIILLLAANGTNSCNVYSCDMQEQATFSLDDLTRSPHNWANYIIGVVHQLLDHGCQVQGFDCVFGGDIPIGAGLSSSAALECGIGFGLNELWDLGLNKLQIVRFAQQAESDFVGVNCGIMDQFANMHGKFGQIIQLDCRSLEYRNVEVDFTGHYLLLLNTNVKHQLGNSEYNIRRMECEAGVKKLQEAFPQIHSLRDCSLGMLDPLDELNDPVIRQRCEYVIEENQRVVKGCEDLKSGDFEAFGEKMYACHEGLSHKYQVSCKELDVLVDLTRDMPQVLGARMMGGGFGGCTINLIKESSVQELITHIGQGYTQATGREMVPYQVKIAEGTSLKECSIAN